MRIKERHFIDEHDYKGRFDFIVTVDGRRTDLNDTALVFGLLEPHLNRHGFSCIDCCTRGKCTIDPSTGEFIRTLIYRKYYPPRYQPNSLVLFNQKYTPYIKEEVTQLRKKNMQTNYKVIVLK